MLVTYCGYAIFMYGQDWFSDVQIAQNMIVTDILAFVVEITNYNNIVFV